MNTFDLVSALIVLTAALSFVNRRFLRLPSATGVTLVGLGVSVALLILVALRVPAAEAALGVLRGVRFDDVLFQGLLSFLLFAGALDLNAGELARQRGAVLTFALVSTLISIVLVGALVYGLLHLVGIAITPAYALLFGALISPTDPVAVLALLKQAGVPPRLETLIAGESLFNDGVGVVAFAVIAAAATGGGEHAVGPLGVAELFFREAVGGVLFGALLGYLAYRLLRQVDDYVVEVLITLAVVTGGYGLAGALGVSGPLAMVVAGLLTGRVVRGGAMSATSRPHFDSFWHLIDEILNAALFSLLALEVIVLRFAPLPLALGLACVPVVLFARAVSVRLPLLALRRAYKFSPFTTQMMTWGGLRGGIAVALAFSVPPGEQRDLFLVLTYVVVVFSIVVQGLSMGRLARAATRAAGEQGMG